MPNSKSHLLAALGFMVMFFLKNQKKYCQRDNMPQKLQVPVVYFIWFKKIQAP